MEPFIDIKWISMDPWIQGNFHRLSSIQITDTPPSAHARSITVTITLLLAPKPPTFVMERANASDERQLMA